jgi:hypothetical protein
MYGTRNPYSNLDDNSVAAGMRRYNPYNLIWQSKSVMRRDIYMGPEELKFQTDKFFESSRNQIERLNMSNEEALGNIRRFLSHLAIFEETKTRPFLKLDR